MDINSPETWRWIWLVAVIAFTVGELTVAGSFYLAPLAVGALVAALGAFAATAITALTAQNTEGVHGVLPIPPDFIRQQMRVVLRDIGADALKTGMLHDVATIEAVCDEIAAEAPGIPLVADPVMVAKGGHPLLQPEAVETLKARLLPLAARVPPWMPSRWRSGTGVRSRAGGCRCGRRPTGWRGCRSWVR